MQSRTLTTYKSIADAIRYAYDDEGYLSIIHPTGTKEPIKIQGKRAVFPTDARLKAGITDDFIFWHPLCESIARRGTSPVMQHIQRTVKANLMWALEYLTEELLKVAQDQDQHKSVPPQCSDFLEKLTNVNKDTYKIFKSLVKGAIKNHRFCSVYLKSDGKYAGKKVTRLCSIRFPILEDLAGPETKLYGVAVNQKQKATLSALFRLVIPNGDDADEYSAGTNNRIAPYFVAFLEAYGKVTTQLNKVIHKYGEPLNLLLKPFPTLPANLVEGFDDYYNEIPKLNGNDGERQTEEEKLQEEQAVAQHNTKPQGQAPAVAGFNSSMPSFNVNTDAPAVVGTQKVAQPSRTAAPAVNEPAKMSPDDFMNAVRQQQTSQYQQPQFQNNMYASNGYNTPNFYAPPVPTGPVVSMFPSNNGIPNHGYGTQYQQAPLSNNPYASVMSSGAPVAPQFQYQQPQLGFGGTFL